MSCPNLDIAVFQMKTLFLLLQDMADDGSWDETDAIHRYVIIKYWGSMNRYRPDQRITVSLRFFFCCRECLKFCFSSVLQRELDRFKMVYNSHKIRQSPNQESPGGKPDILYVAPLYYGKFVVENGFQIFSYQSYTDSQVWSGPEWIVKFYICIFVLRMLTFFSLHVLLLIYDFRGRGLQDKR